MLPLVPVFSLLQFPMLFFREAVDHITRTARILRQHGAHMMLVNHSKYVWSNVSSVYELYTLNKEKGWVFGSIQ